MKRQILILLLLIIFIGLSSNAMTEEGVTDTEIIIAQFGPLVGPAAQWGKILQGVGLLFNIINKEGGIHGRKIIYHAIDDSYIPANTMSTVKKVQERLGIFAWVGGVGTETSLSVKDYLMKKNIPWFFPVTGSECFFNPPNKYLFTIYPPYSFEARILCNYAVKTMGKKNIGMVFQNDRYGKEGLSGAVNELSKYKMELVVKNPIESGDIDLKDCVKKIYEANADAIILFTTPYTAIRLLKIAKDMNFFPIWMGGNSFSGFAKLLYKISQGMWKGIISTSVLDFTDTPLLKKYKEAFEKYGPKNEDWVYYHAGFAFAEPLIEGLRMCGRDLTREKLVQEMEKIKFKGIASTITFKPFNSDNPECRRGAQELYITQCVEDGELKKITDWIRIE